MTLLSQTMMMQLMIWDVNESLVEDLGDETDMDVSDNVEAYIL